MIVISSIRGSTRARIAGLGFAAREPAEAGRVVVAQDVTGPAARLPGAGPPAQTIDTIHGKKTGSIATAPSA